MSENELDALHDELRERVDSMAAQQSAYLGKNRQLLKENEHLRDELRQSGNAVVEMSMRLMRARSLISRLLKAEYDDSVIEELQKFVMEAAPRPSDHTHAMAMLEDLRIAGEIARESYANCGKWLRSRGWVSPDGCLWRTNDPSYKVSGNITMELAIQLTVARRVQLYEQEML